MPRTNTRKETKIPKSKEALMLEIQKCKNQIEKARETYKRYDALTSAAISLFMSKGKSSKKVPEIKRLKIGDKYFVMRPKFLTKDNGYHNAIFKSMGTSVFEFLDESEYKEKYTNKK